MRELHVGNGSIVVSFAVCDALFNYGLALANAGLTDRVTVPVLEDGKQGFSNILLGPMTQLFCTSGGDDDVDLNDESVVFDLELRTASLQTPQVKPNQHAESSEEQHWE